MTPRKLHDDERLQNMIEVERLSQREAGVILGVSTSCVERNCKRLGLKTAPRSYRVGPRHGAWEGGRALLSGYWYLWMPDHPNATKRGYVAEHRKLMEDKIGRLLTRQEVVHHIDGNPQNNALENLMLFQQNSDHLRHELTGRIPNWTPEGKARIQEAVQQVATRRRGLTRDDYKRIRTTGRPPTTP